MGVLILASTFYLVLLSPISYIPISVSAQGPEDVRFQVSTISLATNAQPVDLAIHPTTGFSVL